MPGSGRLGPVWFMLIAGATVFTTRSWWAASFGAWWSTAAAVEEALVVAVPLSAVAALVSTWRSGIGPMQTSVAYGGRSGVLATGAAVLVASSWCCAAFAVGIAPLVSLTLRTATAPPFDLWPFVRALLWVVAAAGAGVVLGYLRQAPLMVPVVLVLGLAAAVLPLYLGPSRVVELPSARVPWGPFLEMSPAVTALRFAVVAAVLVTALAAGHALVRRGEGGWVALGCGVSLLAGVVAPWVLQPQVVRERASSWSEIDCLPRPQSPGAELCLHRSNEPARADVDAVLAEITAAGAGAAVRRTVNGPMPQRAPFGTVCVRVTPAAPTATVVSDALTQVSGSNRCAGGPPNRYGEPTSTPAEVFGLALSERLESLVAKRAMQVEASNPFSAKLSRYTAADVAALLTREGPRIAACQYDGSTL